VHQRERSCFSQRRSTLNFELDPEGIEHRDQAVEATRGLAVLNLMNHPGADSGSKRDLVLPETEAFPFSQYNLSDVIRDSGRGIKL
jgi:hypothetical protein